MKGAIMLSGGGGTKLFAAIGVTYPVGSTVTCTNGTKTLTATPKSEDNTEWVFAIPKPKTLPETWTVTATDKTDSTKTKSASFEIVTEGQLESVVLSYSFELFNGNLASGYTIGRGTASNGVLTAGGAGEATGVYVFAIAIKEPVDVTEYNTMRVTFGDASNAVFLGFGLRSTYSDAYEGNNINNYAAAVYEGSKGKLSNKTRDIDISELSGDYYVKFSGASASFGVTKISFL